MHACLYVCCFLILRLGAPAGILREVSLFLKRFGPIILLKFSGTASGGQPDVPVFPSGPNAILGPAAGPPQLLGLLDYGAPHTLVGERFVKIPSKTFHRFHGHCGVRCPSTSTNMSMRIFPLAKARILDFAGLEAIRHHPSRLSNLSRVFEQPASYS